MLNNLFSSKNAFANLSSGLAIANCGDSLQNVYAEHLQSNITGLTLLSTAVFPSHQAKNRLAYTSITY